MAPLLLMKLILFSAVGAKEIRDKVPGTMDISKTEQRKQLHFILNSDDSGKKRVKRNMIAAGNMRWGTTIHWTIASEFNTTEEEIIDSAISHWAKNTCIRFLRSYGAPRGSYLHFIPAEECSSVIGRVGHGRQDIFIGPKCFTMGKIAHEIGHTLGLWHEHCRPDRDRYVTVRFQNVKDGLQPEFDILSWDSVQTAGVPYDYGSAMHYSSMSFSSNGQSTLEPKLEGYEQTIGQRRSMSFYDFKRINFLYCSDSCKSNSLKWTRCANDGYKDPNDCMVCACPEGFQPPYCSDIQQNDIDGCGRQYIYSNVYSRGTVSSPGFPKGYPGPGACYWIIKSHIATTIVITFDQSSSLHCDVHACKDYVEIRIGDLARTGRRYCCSVPSQPIRSSGSQVMAIFRSESSNLVKPGFKFHYHSEACGGCGLPISERQRACVTSKRISCPGYYTTQCESRDGLCTRYRKNTCYEEQYNCCMGYSLHNDTCQRETWREWGKRSPCSGKA